MAHDYLKAVIKSTVIENRSDPDISDACEDDMETESNHSMGLRSPGGPMRGRSIKEFEEQLANLKKENFNLKLRIYFLEERMGSNFNLDKENVVKKNVELMVDVESLRKELQEKHDLLCQAVKAMELEEDEHKKLVDEKDDIIAEFNNEVESLRGQLLDTKHENDTLSHKSFASSPPELMPLMTAESLITFKELQEKTTSLEEELNQEKENNVAFQMVLDQKDTKINALLEQIADLNAILNNREDDVNELKFRLEENKGKYYGLCTKLEEATQTASEMLSENNELRKRQAMYLADIEKERKRYEKLKLSSDLKTNELQSKLEASLGELKKSQDLVVSKSPGRRPGFTDADSFSVSKPATSPRPAQTNPFSFPCAPSPIVTPSSSPCPSPSVSFNSSTDMRCAFEQLRSDRDMQLQKIHKLKVEQMKACKIIKTMMESRKKMDEDVEKLKRRIGELEQELEGVVSRPAGEGAKGSAVSSSNLPHEETSMGEHSMDLVQEYKALIEELDEKNQILVATLHEKDSQMEVLQDQYEELLKTPKQRDNFDLDALSTKLEKCVQVGEGDSYKGQLEEKDEEIERLTRELSKRTCDLQGLVNTELWDKNREIEKLHKHRCKDQEIIKLQNDLAAKEAQLDLIKSKILELGIEIDGHVLERNLQAELEQSEMRRCAAVEVGNVLNKRLEELAVFLDSLLKQKSVLGFLGQKENKRLRQIIDQSLDLSRSFTMSMMINPEQSLMQLTNISSILNDTLPEPDASRLSLVPTNATLTYQSHLYKKEEDGAQIIEALRQQIVNLKHELQLRDVELNKLNDDCAISTEMSSEKDNHDMNTSTVLNTSTTLKYKSDNQSESEAWSEPDRNVSRARIGLVDATLKNKKKAPSTDSTEEEEAAEGIIRTPGKKGVLNETRSVILELHAQVCDLNEKLTEKEIRYVEIFSENQKLKLEVDQLGARLREVEETKELVENTVEEKNDQIADFQENIHAIEKEKAELLEDLKTAENKSILLQEQMTILEASLRADYERELLEKEECFRKMNESDKEIEMLRQAIEQLQSNYLANYVQKCQVENMLEDNEQLKSAVEELQNRIEEMNGQEVKLKTNLNEFEEKINYLRSDLDNATLQYSEAVLDKTKMASEKAMVEQECNKSVLREVDLKKQLDEVENEISVLKHNHQKQVYLMQQQKSKLEVQMSELESSNAQLHNRLIKIQSGWGDNFLSSSLPNTPNFVNQIVSFRRQHSENSAYSVEVEATRSYNRLVVNHNVDVERRHANSSPDLGIESDGRFSSLEMHLNVPRPLLQTLELTESMSNLLDGDNNQIININNCDNEHCCQKTLEISNENTDLKRKLLRTRRALEETVTQLTLANQRKKQVEKTICKQIHKTSQVLRKAKANLDSGSETDVLYKK